MCRHTEDILSKSKDIYLKFENDKVYAELVAQEHTKNVFLLKLVHANVISTLLVFIVYKKALNCCLKWKIFKGVP